MKRCEAVAKYCIGCLEAYYGPSVGTLYCSDRCFKKVSDQLDALGKVNREQCEKHDREQAARARREDFDADPYHGGSAHQALERAETTDEEPTGQPTQLGKA